MFMKNNTQIYPFTGFYQNPYNRISKPTGIGRIAQTIQNNLRFRELLFKSEPSLN